MAVSCIMLLDCYIYGTLLHLFDIDFSIRYKVRQKLVDRFGLPNLKVKIKTTTTIERLKRTTARYQPVKKKKITII